MKYRKFRILEILNFHPCVIILLGTLYYLLEDEDPEGDNVTFSATYDQRSDVLGTLSITEEGG